MQKMNPELKTACDKYLAALAEKEALDAEDIKKGLQSGTMVLLYNPAHENCIPTLIGQPASVKINANLGTSPFLIDRELELSKARTAVEAGADTVMDLSTGGDLEMSRKRFLQEIELPLGTVPIYCVAQDYIAAGEDPAKMGEDELIREIEHQAVQGVDFMTLHCGVTRRAVQLAKQANRKMGIVSRGGSLLARWMDVNDQENPLLERFDEILDICARHNVVISLGDGLRPGAGADAGDSAQWEEVIVLSQLARLAREKGVQVMIEGPGHVPLHQVESQVQQIKRVCDNAPLYVLGPLTTDISPGYDHIGGAIGGALACRAGADFLCYITPAEHLTLPNEYDVWQGVMASAVAAHSAEVSLGRSGAIEKNNRISEARKALDWESIAEYSLDPGMVKKRRENFASKEECAMCGEFCAVKLFR
ncbi:MAG: phosphomethylpyrimidine synthase ThiC [Thermodesulfobacteriota bacterium]